MWSSGPYIYNSNLPFLIFCLPPHGSELLPLEDAPKKKRTRYSDDTLLSSLAKDNANCMHLHTLDAYSEIAAL